MQSIDSGSDSEGSTHIEDILEQEPMYYVFGKFLETADNKNIATVLQELVVEVQKLRETVAVVTLNAPAPSTSPLPVVVDPDVVRPPPLRTNIA